MNRFHNLSVSNDYWKLEARVLSEPFFNFLELTAMLWRIDSVSQFYNSYEYIWIPLNSSTLKVNQYARYTILSLTLITISLTFLSDDELMYQVKQTQWIQRPSNPPPLIRSTRPGSDNLLWCSSKTKTLIYIW